MASEPFETAHNCGYPCVRQFSVFIENRVGSLLRFTRVFDNTEVRILGMSVIDTFDCSIVRIVVDDPDEAEQILLDDKLALCESEVVVVGLPPGKRGLLTVLSALMAGEINVHYTYPLLIHPHGEPALAISTDDLYTAISILMNKKLTVFDQADLNKKF